MRKLAFLLIVAGVAIGAILPGAQLYFSGNRVEEVSVFNRQAGGWKQAIVKLSPADNPVRIQFFAKYLVDGKLPPVKIPLRVVVRDKAGILMTTFISLPTKARSSGPEQEKVRSTTAPLFTVEQSGPHTLDVSFAPNKNNGNILVPDVANITASFTANAVKADETHKVPAVLLVMSGLYLLMRSRRSKKKEKPVQRWGRGE